MPDSTALSLAEFPNLSRVLQEGIDRRLHSGVQVYVSRDTQPLLDIGSGLASAADPLTADHPMLWRSAGKPLTAFLIGQRIASGKCDLSTKLVELIPEAAETDKSHITLFELLTHTSGFPNAETGWPFNSWNDSLTAVLKAPCTLTVGTAAYHPLSSWFLLGEILRRTASHEVSFSELMRRELLLPLGMIRSAASTEDLKPEGVIVPVMYERIAGELVESVYSRQPYSAQVSPGGSIRGPVRELGHFYEMLLRRGRLADGVALADEQTVSQMVSRHRAGQYDQTFQHIVDFGLGIIVNGNRYGADSVPYGFGRLSSPKTFGHGGSQCSMGFCDPEHSLVVTWAMNGLCGEGQHQRRNRAINEAIYRDLSIRTGEELPP